MKQHDSSDLVLVVTTCGNSDLAQALAVGLVENRLAACVQADHIQSVYRWEGAVEVASEVRLTIKARASHYATVEQFIREHHSYENPEIIAIAVNQASQAYLRWIAEETAG